jgi:hypothetical protein
LPIAAPGVYNGKVEVDMIRTVEAVIDQEGKVHLLAAVTISSPCRALVTILEEAPLEGADPALLSEPALAEDWGRPEEDAAWSYLASAT